MTGTLRGGPLERGASVRLVPGDATVRARELQVHNAAVEAAGPGRTAVNVAGVEASTLSRGQVLTADPVSSRRTACSSGSEPAVPDRTHARLHLGTAAVDVAVGRSGRDAIDLPNGVGVAAILRLAEPVAAAPGDRFVLRRPSGAHQVVGGQVVDVVPARGVSRRRQTSERVAALSAPSRPTIARQQPSARLELHGAVASMPEGVRLAPDVDASASATAVSKVADGTSLADLRTATARAIRRSVTLTWEEARTAAGSVVDALVRDGRLVRAGDRVTLPGAAGPASRTRPWWPRWTASSGRCPPRRQRPSRTRPAPPAAHPTGSAPSNATAGSIVLEPSLAYATATYHALTAQALALAEAAPLTPAALRDATGTSRRYVMAILEDLDRRGSYGGRRRAIDPVRARPPSWPLDDDRRDRACRRPVVALRARQARRARRRCPDAGPCHRGRGRRRRRGTGRRGPASRDRSCLRVPAGSTTPVPSKARSPASMPASPRRTRRSCSWSAATCRHWCRRCCAASSMRWLTRRSRRRCWTRPAVTARCRWPSAAAPAAAMTAYAPGVRRAPAARAPRRARARGDRGRGLAGGRPGRRDPARHRPPGRPCGLAAMHE